MMLNEEQNMPWKPGKHKLILYIYICHETFIKQIRNKNMPWKPGEINIYMPWKPGKYTHALETREIYTCPGNQGNIYMPWKPGKAGKSYKTCHEMLNEQKEKTNMPWNHRGNKMYLGMMV